MITTSFGSIRPWHPEDAEALAAYADNPKIWRQMRDSFPHPFTMERAHAFIDATLKPSSSLFLALASPHEAIGGIGITRGDDVHHRTAELGYWLAEPFWGRGYMRTAIVALTSYLFAQTDLLRIYAEPFASNLASIRALERAGYSCEGRLHCSVVKEGKVLDQLLFAAVWTVYAAPEGC